MGFNSDFKGLRLSFAGGTNMDDEMLNNVSSAAAASQKTHCLYITNSD
jgi:hypothetical protein